MSSATRKQRSVGAWVDELPTFDLDFLYDDRDDPTEVTVFPEDGSHDLSTNWITADIDHTIPLNEIQ